MTDVKVVTPMNMGNTLMFKDKVYNVNIGDTLTVGDNYGDYSMATKILTPADLSDDFIVAPDNKVYCVKSTSTSTSTSIKFYTGVSNSTINIFSSSSNDDWKRRLTLSNNLGIIHLEFTRSEFPTGTSTVVSEVLTFPSDAPTPINTLEVQTREGGSVYIEAGTRTVLCKGLTSKRRYVVDLIGFFQ